MALYVEAETNFYMSKTFSALLKSVTFGPPVQTPGSGHEKVAGMRSEADDTSGCERLLCLRSRRIELASIWSHPLNIIRGINFSMLPSAASPQYEGSDTGAASHLVACILPR
jgi:hypothetical protein